MNNDFFINFFANTESLKKAKADIDRLNEANQKLGTDVPKAHKIINSSFTHVIEKNGALTRYLTVNWKTASGQYYQTSGTLENANKIVAKSIVDTGSKMKSYAAQMGALAQRAAMTIPIWLALRGAVMAIGQTFSQGVEYLLESDKQLAHATQFLSSSVEEHQKQLEILTRESEKASAKTGISVGQMRETFIEFATTGLSFEASVAGMKAAGEGSVAMFTDMKTLATSLAQTMLLLGDSFGKTLTEEEKYKSLIGLIIKLDKDNAFSLGEFASSMQNFSGTAKAMNFTIGESVSFLAALNTAGIKAGKAGTLLRSSTLQLAQHYKDVGAELGIYVDENDRLPEVFERIVAKLKELQAAGRNVEAAEITAKLFGGAKGSQVVQYLTSVLELFKKNTEASKDNAEANKQNIDVFNNRLGVVTNSLFKQTEIATNLNKELTAAFFKGALEATRFQDIIKGVNELLGNTSENAQKAGRDTVNFFKEIVLGPGLAAVRLAMGATGEATIRTILSMGTAAGDLVQVAKDAESIYDSINAAPIQKNNVPSKEIDPVKVQMQLKETTKEKLTLLQQELKYVQMAANYYNDIQISQAKLVDHVSALVEKYNKIAATSDKRIEMLTTEQILTLAQAGNYEKIVQLLGVAVDGQKEVLDIAKLVNEVEQKRIEMQKQYSDAFRSNMSASLSSLIQQETTIDQFINDIGAKMRKQFADAFSEGLTKKLFSQTGIGDVWGNILGKSEGLTDKLIPGSQQGSMFYYDAILNASRMGSAMYQQVNAGQIAGGQSASVASAAGLGLGALGVGAGALALGQTGGTYPGGYAPAGYADPIGKYSGGGGGLSGIGSAFSTRAAGQKFSLMGGIMGGVTGAMMNSGRGGAAMAMSGIGGVLMSIPTPPTMIIGAILTLASMFMGKKKKTTEDTSSWQQETVKDMTPNFGVNVAPLPSMYALPKSAYFSRPSQIAISINIDKVQGTNEEVANQIAEKVSIHMGKAQSVDYQRQIMRGDMAGPMIF
jgi:TP901 family phage tail tape measure protein